MRCDSQGRLLIGLPVPARRFATSTFHYVHVSLRKFASCRLRVAPATATKQIENATLISSGRRMLRYASAKLSVGDRAVSTWGFHRAVSKLRRAVVHAVLLLFRGEMCARPEAPATAQRSPIAQPIAQSSFVAFGRKGMAACVSRFFVCLLLCVSRL